MKTVVNNFLKENKRNKILVFESHNEEKIYILWKN